MNPGDWDAQAVVFLQAFMTDPEGTVSIPVREAIEMLRGARDLDAMLLGAPSTHHQRLDMAANLIEVVLDGATTNRHWQRESLRGAWNLVRKVARAEEKRELEAVGEVLGRAPEPPPTPNPELVAGVMERATVPRHVLLKQQRAKARRASEGDDDDEQGIDEAPGGLPKGQ